MVAISKNKMFTVVILSYCNKENWKDAIASVLQQEYPALEVIFADDGSPNFSREEVEHFIVEHKQHNLLQYCVLTSINNMGTVKNVSRAIVNCHGKYLLIMAADDALYDSGVLAAFASALERQGNDTLGVYARSIQCDETLSPSGECSFDIIRALSMNRQSALIQWKTLCHGCCIHMGATAFLWERFVPNKFDTSYRILEDWPFFLQTTEAGWRYEFENFNALRYRSGGISRGRDFNLGREQCFRDQLRMYERYILPNMSRFAWKERLTIYCRYRNDRMDVWLHYRMKSDLPLSSVVCLVPSGQLLEGIWAIIYFRRFIFFVIMGILIGWALPCRLLIWLATLIVFSVHLKIQLKLGRQKNDSQHQDN